MAEWTRALPAVPLESKAYWDACKEGKIIIQKCRGCGLFQMYYRQFCCHCWGTDLEDVASSGTGTVWGHTVTYKNSTPGWEDFVPYCMALIEMDDTGGVKMVTNIVNCDPESVYVGMPVRATFVAATDDITIPYFEPIDG